MFEFILFAILGWRVFAPPGEKGQLALMILFIVFMAGWVIVGYTGYDVPGHLGFSRPPR